MPLTSTTTDARTTTRRRADLARTLTPAPADPRPIGALLVVLVAALLVVAGVLWLAEWRDESRATKRAVEVEPCR